MSDWWGSNSGGGSSSDWWGSTSKPKPKAKKSSGGGGFFDSIGGFLGGLPGVGVAEHAGGQAWDIIHGTPSALVSLPGDILHTLGPHGVTANLGTPWDKYLPGYHPNQKLDPHNLIQATTHATAQDIEQARRGNWHYFEQHPLNPVLDIATLGSFGGAGAVRLAGRGALGERAAALANEPRLLHVGTHSEELSQARTLSGRIRQAAFDRFSEAHPDMRVVGSTYRMRKILNHRMQTTMLRARVPVRAFQDLTKGLRPEERFGFHIAAEGVPLADRLDYYHAQLAERPTKALRDYVKQLESPKVAEALANPRPEFVAAVQAGKDLEARAGERLVQTGQLSSETRAERAALPQDVMTGSATTGRNLVNPAFPEPFRFRHVGTEGRPSQFIAPKTEGMLGKAAPLTQLRHNSAVRLRNAMLLTDPEHVITADYLQTMRHEAIIQMQKEALDPVSEALSAEHVGTGFKAEGEYYYRPSYDRKTTAPVPRQVREQQAITQDRLATTEAERTRVSEAAGGVVAKNLRELGVDQADLHNLDKLDQLGIRRVPAAFGKQFSQEFGGTSFAIRAFIDRPLDVWRAITLNYRPAWAVNNFVGNAMMGLATYGPAGAAAYLRVLLRTERGPQKVQTLFRWTFSRPTLRRKYGQVFREVAPELHSAGLFGTQTKVTRGGVYEGRLAGLAANPAVKALGFAPKKLGQGVLAIGRGVTKVEVLFAEDTSREAAFIREAGGDVAKVRAAAKKMGEGNLSLAEALKRLDRPSVERAVRGVNDALGDFNDLSHAERAVLRRAVPFYSWFKVITKVSGKYAARYPARLEMLRAIEQAQDKKGEPALPSWLTGAILLGKPSHGVQALISTQGLNPYETLPQIASGGAGSVLNPFATAGVVGLTGRNPAFGNLEDYYGLGATNRSGWAGQLERGGGSLLSGLAPARLYQQTAEPYQGKLYAPKTYHAGPVPISDFWLQYFGLPLRHVKLAEAKRERGL